MLVLATRFALIQRVVQNGAVYIYTSPPGISLVDGPQYEQLIDAKYLDLSNSTDAWRLESYRAAGNVSSGVAQQLRCYFISKCHFPTRETTQSFTDEESPEDVKVDIRTVSDSAFLEKATDNTLEIYQEVMDEALNRFVFPLVLVQRD